MSDNASYFKNLRTRYLAFRLTEIALWSIAFGALTYGLGHFFDFTVTFRLAISFAVVAFAFASKFRILGLQNLSQKRFIKYINSNYPELEESVDLLFKHEHEMTALQRLQKEKITAIFERIFPTIQLPQKLGRAVLVFLAASAISFGLISFAPLEKNKLAASGEEIDLKTRPAATVLPIDIADLSITIIPPAYTALKKVTITDPQLVVAENSRVTWSVQFSGEVKGAKLVFSGRDTLNLKSSGDSRVISRKIDESGFYQILWTNSHGKTRTSDFYKIEVIYDRSPDVKFENLRQSTEFTIRDKQSFQIRASIADDYKITDAYIIATVAKGSGESVKFREEKLLFTSPSKVSGKRITATRMLDLKELGLEPGDELYFYAEALDNHQPTAQRSRTETYFVSLQDTARQQLSVEAGLGVDLMPEYFRSQRQIIIDTEKLLTQKNLLTKHQFNFTSNELGYDQKVLRLKYGEFLGEEFESEVAETEDPELPEEVQEEEETDEEDPDDPTKKFGHAHDEKENLHNLVEEKKGKDAHDHEEEQDPEKEKDPIAAFKHTHDNTEEATFFTQSIRAKLKAALTVMWDAELHLRMYEPQKSLPYQYQALKLLKEISNDSRIYVHKTGFDPPPLKEEKRLTGDLAGLKSSQAKSDLLQSNNFQDAVLALELSEQLLHQHRDLTQKDMQIFRNAGRELSSFAIEYPGKYLVALSLLKTLSENETNKKELPELLEKLRNSLFDRLPEKTPSPAQHAKSRHELDKIFIQTLEAMRHE
jgi:hypothetical protein